MPVYRTDLSSDVRHRARSVVDARSPGGAADDRTGEADSARRSRSDRSGQERLWRTRSRARAAARSCRPTPSPSIAASTSERRSPSPSGAPGGSVSPDRRRGSVGDVSPPAAGHRRPAPSSTEVVEARPAARSCAAAAASTSRRCSRAPAGRRRRPGAAPGLARWGERNPESAARMLAANDPDGRRADRSRQPALRPARSRDPARDRTVRLVERLPVADAWAERFRVVKVGVRPAPADLYARIAPASPRDARSGVGR